MYLSRQAEVPKPALLVQQRDVGSTSPAWLQLYLTARGPRERPPGSTTALSQQAPPVPVCRRQPPCRYCARWRLPWGRPLWAGPLPGARNRCGLGSVQFQPPPPFRGPQLHLSSQELNLAPAFSLWRAPKASVKGLAQLGIIKSGICFICTTCTY